MKDYRVGETNIASNGMRITIIKYRGVHDIDIQFEDGYIAKHKGYKEFKNGNIRHNIVKPKINRKVRDKTGEQVEDSNGVVYTICKYRTGIDLDIKSSNGELMEHTSYSRFKKLKYRAERDRKNKTTRYEIGIRKIQNNALNRIGEQVVTNEGHKIKIINYNGCKNITVQFEDGTTKVIKSYQQFKNGQVSYPVEHKISRNTTGKCKQALKNYRIGETRTIDGITMTIIGYVNSNDITIRLSTGYVLEHFNYKRFKECKQVPHVRMCKLGEQTVTKQGITAVIVDYNNTNNITVRFEDGTILKNQIYQSFINGYIKYRKDLYVNIQVVGIFKEEKICMCKCRKCKGKHVLKLSEMKDFECKDIKV